MQTVTAANATKARPQSKQRQLWTSQAGLAAAVRQLRTVQLSAPVGTRYLQRTECSQRGNGFAHGAYYPIMECTL